MSCPHHTIGVCTGGGDCPGLNAAIRAVVRTAVRDNDYVRAPRTVGIAFGDRP
jgi:6-phosphofructokinase